MTALDRRLLNRLQEDIPFISRPWEALADELKVNEDLLLKRVALLKKKGIIRRISAVFSPRMIHYVSTLVAVKTAPDRVAQVAARINVYPEVTHNYGRAASFNLWFTLIARDRKRIRRILRRVRKDKDILSLSEFEAVKLFKINVKFAT